MGIDWKKLYVESGGCKDEEELKKLMMSCGIEKGEVFRVMRSSVGSMGRDRSYREERNKGLNELRSEVKRLRKELGKS